jgi:hypothetical protein
MNAPGRYRFDTLFVYHHAFNNITPKFTVIINGVRLEAHVPIWPTTNTGGINLFNYIGKDISATWNPSTRSLTILGFYP